MCAFSHTYVSKSKHVWKIAPRCKYTNVFGFFQTCWVKVKHLPKWTCVVFYTQVWLFSNIFAKSQTCVKKTIMFHWIFPYRFSMEIKILLISAQFCLIYFHFLKTHLSWNVYNLIYDLNFLVFSVRFQLIICQTRSSWASWNGKSWVESLTFLERNWQHQSFQDCLPLGPQRHLLRDQFQCRGHRHQISTSTNNQNMQRSNLIVITVSAKQHKKAIWSCTNYWYIRGQNLIVIIVTTNSKNNQSLNNHKQLKHKGITYDCNQCEYKATTTGSLKVLKQSQH